LVLMLKVYLVIEYIFEVKTNWDKMNILKMQF